MAIIEGMLTLDQLEKLVSSDEIDTVLMVFADSYGRLMGKRMAGNFFVEEAAQSGIHACNYLLTVDMELEPVPGYKFSNWGTGYGDFHLAPDFHTLRIASWLDKTAMVLCDVEEDDTKKPVQIAPRSLLKAQIKKAAKMGYTAHAASELEYYIFEDSYKSAKRQNYHGIQPIGWYSEDYFALQGAREEFYNGAVRRHLTKSGIPVENTKGETGIGQHELNIKYTDVLTMADRHSIYKQCMKEVADSMGISVTFMAKYKTDQAGSSCHIHMSLWEGDKSAFPGNKTLGKVKCSDVFRWFLGGWMAHCREMMVCYAPTVNSYKRFQNASWAPTKIAWSYDNRTAGFRIVGHGNSLRIECRIPGADCHPYIAFAASLASGLDGIENQIDPPPMFQGDGYHSDLPTVPYTFTEAIDAFEKSKFARKAFGKEVVEHYLHFFRKEQETFDNAVTDWERQRYFERI